MGPTHIQKQNMQKANLKTFEEASPIDKMFELVKQGKIPYETIWQSDAEPYLTRLYAAKAQYAQAHPLPAEHKSLGKWCRNVWDKLFGRTEKRIAAEQLQELAALDATPIVDAYAKGIEFGKTIANTTGGQDILFAETHNETEQYNAMVGAVRGFVEVENLKPEKDRRQIIIL